MENVKSIFWTIVLAGLIGLLFVSLPVHAEPLFGPSAPEDVSCTDTCDQSNSKLTEKQKQCVLKKYCTPKDKWHKVVVEKEKHSPRNSVSLLLGISRTGLKSDDNLAPAINVETRHQGDVGLMYQRDFSRSIRGTVGATVRKSLYIGVGLNF